MNVVESVLAVSPLESLASEHLRAYAASYELLWRLRGSGVDAMTLQRAIAAEQLLLRSSEVRTTNGRCVDNFRNLIRVNPQILALEDWSLYASTLVAYAEALSHPSFANHPRARVTQMRSAAQAVVIALALLEHHCDASVLETITGADPALGAILTTSTGATFAAAFRALATSPSSLVRVVAAPQLPSVTMTAPQSLLDWDERQSPASSSSSSSSSFISKASCGAASRPEDIGSLSPAKRLRPGALDDLLMLMPVRRSQSSGSFDATRNIADKENATATPMAAASILVVEPPQLPQSPWGEAASARAHRRSRCGDDEDSESRRSCASAMRASQLMVLLSESVRWVATAAGSAERVTAECARLCEWLSGVPGTPTSAEEALATPATAASRAQLWRLAIRAADSAWNVCAPHRDATCGERLRGRSCVAQLAAAASERFVCARELAAIQAEGAAQSQIGSSSPRRVIIWGAGDVTSDDEDEDEAAPEVPMEASRCFRGEEVDTEASRASDELRQLMRVSAARLEAVQTWLERDAHTTRSMLQLELDREASDACSEEGSAVAGGIIAASTSWSECGDSDWLLGSPVVGPTEVALMAGRGPDDAEAASLCALFHEEDGDDDEDDDDTRGSGDEELPSTPAAIVARVPSSASSTASVGSRRRVRFSIDVLRSPQASAAVEAEGRTDWHEPLVSHVASLAADASLRAL